MSSALNDAYRTLKDPDQARAISAEAGRLRHRRAALERCAAGAARRGVRAEHGAGRNARRRRFRAAAVGSKPETNFSGMLGDVDRAARRRCSRSTMARRKRETLAEIRGVLNRRKYIQNLLNEVQTESGASNLTMEIDFGAHRPHRRHRPRHHQQPGCVHGPHRPAIIPGADGDKLVPSVVSDPAERRGRGRESRARVAARRSPSAPSIR